MIKFIQNLSVFLNLSKIKITLPVTGTMILGYLLKAGTMQSELWCILPGFILLVAGSCCLNQVQEHQIDGSMRRTARRPLPTGQISIFKAQIAAFISISLGLIILWLAANQSVFFLSLLALVWYNGIYTPLKQRTVWAAIPGAVIGALPPLIGWTGAGGKILDPQILMVAGFFFFWQVPHFWLILLIHQTDYEQSGLPVLTQKIRPEQVRHLILFWMILLAEIVVILPLFNLLNLFALSLISTVMAWGLIWQALKLLQIQPGRPALELISKRLNTFAGLVTLLLIFSRFYSL